MLSRLGGRPGSMITSFRRRMGAALKTRPPPADEATVSDFSALILRPGIGDLDQLVEPLTPGEQQVCDALARLEAGWTIYVKPRLGLDRPDFLAVHERFGVCAIQVADWAPGTVRCSDDGRLEFFDDQGLWSPVAADPRFEASRHRSSIFDRFYALPEHGGSPTASIRGVVIVPGFTTPAAGDLFARCADAEDRSLIGVWGGDALGASIGDVVRGLGCPPPPPICIAKLRRHVVAAERVQPLGWESTLSPQVIELAENPQGHRHRVILGAAGSGKSTVVAARAAHLAAQGRSVLVLSFNVTLSNRLRESVDRHSRSVGANPTLVSCANFHTFCARVVQDAEIGGARLKVPRGLPWTQAIVTKTEQAYEMGFGERYDAILIDEGQDYQTSWWDLLVSHTLLPGGESLVTADPTQDIYDRVEWLDELHTVDGEDVVRTELGGSIRLPGDLIAIADSFASSHLDGRVLPTGSSEPDSADAGSVRHWVDVDRVNDLGAAIGREVVRLLRDSPTLTPGDISFVCDYHHDGVAAVRVIESAGIPVHHIFSRDPDAPRRRRKHRFWPDVAAVKGCTVHSLKGWESRVIVFGIGADDRAKRLAYVAMTRASRPLDGTPAFVSAVNADRSLADFAPTFTANSARVPSVGQSLPGSTTVPMSTPAAPMAAPPMPAPPMPAPPMAAPPMPAPPMPAPPMPAPASTAAPVAAVVAAAPLAAPLAAPIPAPSTEPAPASFAAPAPLTVSPPAAASLADSAPVVAAPTAAIQHAPAPLAPAQPAPAQPAPLLAPAAPLAFAPAATPIVDTPAHMPSVPATPIAPAAADAPGHLLIQPPPPLIPPPSLLSDPAPLVGYEKLQPVEPVRQPVAITHDSVDLVAPPPLS
ncbi:MAG: UvrD-helicase domain-containing protein [Ilumatobacter sp.]